MILAALRKRRGMCKITIDVTPEGSKELFEILNSLTLKIDLLMTKQERFNGILDRLNDVTNNLAEDFKTFIQEVKDGTVSDESLTKAEENVAALEQLAASKENPVPGETTPPADEEGTDTGAGTPADGNQANNPQLG